MLIVITILVNAILGVAFKKFRDFDIDNEQAIIVNYFVCALTGSLVVMRPIVTLDVIHRPWFPFAVVLSILFITIFNVVAKTIQELGILVTTLFQKMSLIWPTIFGILFFAEDRGIIKIIGLVLAIISIFLINAPTDKKTTTKQVLGMGAFLAIATFAGSGIIEILLYYVKQMNYVQGDDIEFTGTLFFLAGCNGLLFFIIKSFFKKPNLQFKNIIGGIVLGVPNFFTIYWILVLLQQGFEGSVLFPIMNVGILVFNALIGITIFKEAINRKRLVGFMAAIAAIGLLVLNG